MGRSCIPAFTMLVFLCGQSTATRAQVVMEWVTVRDAGNQNDIHGAGYGGVDGQYRLARYEVTNGQYRAFLNAVAATDPNNLYHTNMAAQFGGIVRNGGAGNYTYTPKNGDAEWDTRPVNFVNFYDALRFINWLHNSQPTGAQGTLTTEDGAYSFLGSETVGSRNPDALVFLPTEDEWYKAAYYQGGGAGAGYWDYATQSDDPPVAEAPPGGDSSANYQLPDESLAVGSPYYNTVVGAYALSQSAYGTRDQNGNLWEWNESQVGSNRNIRGGSWFSDAIHLAASFRFSAGYAPANHDSNVGFRVAGLSESPSSPAASGWGLLAMLLIVLTVGTLAFGRNADQPG